LLRPGLWSGKPARDVFAALGRTKGVALKNGALRQDSTLQGCSCIDGTFSWIEPTSWCLLALKKHPSPAARRKIRADGRSRAAAAGLRLKKGDG